MPALRGRIVDRADLLPAREQADLESVLAAFEKSTGHQIVVHTTPSLEGLEIEEYSMEVAEAWKIGHKGLDNGVILTVAPNEKRVRIEVGYGLEGVLPDVIAKRIIDEQITPRFRDDDFAGGVRAGAEAIMLVTRGEELPIPEAARRGQAGRRRGGGLPPFAYLLILLLVFGSRGFLFLPFMLGSSGRMRSSGGFGGGGFGGGGFGGGGGGFGGGGASGGW